jgi:hypothetical protein
VETLCNSLISQKTKFAFAGEWAECDFHYLDLLCLFAQQCVFDAAALKSASALYVNPSYSHKFERVSIQKNMLVLHAHWKSRFHPAGSSCSCRRNLHQIRQKRRRVAMRAQIGAGGCNPGEKSDKLPI